MTKKLNFKSILSLLLVVVFTLSIGLTVFADDPQKEVEKQLVSSVISGTTSNLNTYADTNAIGTLEKVISKNYKVEGGGSRLGSTIITYDATNYPYYTFSEENFNSLSSDGKNSFMSDLVSNSQKIKAGSQEFADKKNTIPPIDNDTVNEFWSNLQNEKGVGVTFMTTILQHTKPDFVRANQIYEPFSGVVGTILGLGAVLIMALLGIVMVADIAYIALPPVRMLADGKGSHDIGSHLFSAEALNAVKIAEAHEKNALAYYFKKRVIMLIVLGICLLYLIQGRIYTLVGWVLNLLSGVL